MKPSQLWGHVMPDERADLAGYIAAMAAELAKMANQNGLEMIGYMLELASAEADDKKRALESDRATRPSRCQ
jgi:hypothetical protein